MQVAVAYVSLVVPDAAEYKGPAAHNNGMTYMREILFGLRRGGFSSLTAISARPIAAYPRCNRIWVQGGRVDLEGTPVQYVSFVNITLLKQIGIGVGVMFRLALWGWRRRKEEKVVVLYNLSVPPVICVALAARVIGAKLIPFVGDVYVPGDTVPNKWIYRVDAWMQRWMLKYVDALVVVADSIANDFAPNIPYLRLDGGLPAAALRVVPPSEPKRKETFDIVVSGSLSAFNGIAQIIEAFSLLTASYYRLHIAGRGPLEAIVRSAAAKDERIHFAGFLNYEDLLRLHAEADVLVSLRITKGLKTQYAFPSKTMEYLASGVPVITTNTGHMAQEYGPLCIVLEGESAGDLVAGVRRVEAIPPSERAAMGLAARRYMLENKTWEAQTTRLVEFIKIRTAKSRG